MATDTIMTPRFLDLLAGETPRSEIEPSAAPLPPPQLPASPLRGKLVALEFALGNAEAKSAELETAVSDAKLQLQNELRENQRLRAESEAHRSTARQAEASQAATAQTLEDAKTLAEQLVHTLSERSATTSPLRSRPQPPHRPSSSSPLPQRLSSGAQFDEHGTPAVSDSTGGTACAGGVELTPLHLGSDELLGRLLRALGSSVAAPVPLLECLLRDAATPAPVASSTGGAAAQSAEAEARAEAAEGRAADAESELASMEAKHGLLRAQLEAVEAERERFVELFRETSTAGAERVEESATARSIGRAVDAAQHSGAEEEVRLEALLARCTEAAMVWATSEQAGKQRRHVSRRAAEELKNAASLAAADASALKQRRAEMRQLAGALREMVRAHEQERAARIKLQELLHSEHNAQAAAMRRCVTEQDVLLEVMQHKLAAHAPPELAAELGAQHTMLRRALAVKLEAASAVRQAEHSRGRHGGGGGGGAARGDGKVASGGDRMFDSALHTVREMFGRSTAEMAAEAGDLTRRLFDREATRPRPKASGGGGGGGVGGGGVGSVLQHIQERLSAVSEQVASLTPRSTFSQSM